MTNKILKYILITFCFLIILCGCVTTGKAIYSVNDNYNVLDIGNFEVSISKRFQYYGISSHRYKGKSTEPEGNTIIYDNHVFIDTSNGKENVKKVIFVLDKKLTNHDQYFTKDASFDNYRWRHIEKGVKEVNQVKCAYLVIPIKDISPELFNANAFKDIKITQNDTFGLQIKLAKVISNRNIINIIYEEFSNEDYENNSSKVDSSIKAFESYIRFQKNDH